MAQPANLHERATAALAVSIGIAAAISSLSPRASVVLLIIVGLAASAVCWPRARTLLDLGMSSPIMIAGAMLITYLVWSAGWALDQSAALSKSTGLAVIAALAAIAFAGIQQLDDAATRRAAKIFLVGAAAGAVFVTIEFASGQAITRALFNLLPMLRPEAGKDIVVDGGRVVQIARYELNRNMAVLVLLLWPALAVLLQGGERWRLWVGAAAVALTALLAFSSDHESSMIAIGVSTIVMGLALWRGQMVGYALMVAWCLAFLLVIPASLLAYQKAELHHAPWLPTTAQARIIIWGYTAEQVAKNPIFGIGVRSTRVLDTDLLPTAERVEGDVFARRPGRHAHNLFLQSWFELGLIGVVLVMGFGVLILRRLVNLPNELRPFACALFAAFMVIACFAWGMWQTWLLAAYALSALYLTLAAHLHASNRGKDTA
jgi:hypothetical protein